jgi:WD40 repeat protein
VDGGVFGDRKGLQLLALAPDERVVAVGGIDGSVRVWELETRVKLETLRSRVHLRTGHAARTTALAFSPDGGFLATGHLDGSIYLWDATTGLESEVVLRHEGPVGGLAFADDGAALVSGGLDGTLKVWEMEAVLAGEARRQLRRQPAGVTCLAVAEGRVLSGHENRVIRVQDLQSGRLAATLHGHHAPPTVLAVSPAGDRLAAGGRDCAIRVFDLESRQQVQVLEGHARGVCSVAWFADGERLASAAMENQLMVWSVAAGLPVATHTGEAGESFASAAVVAGGHRLLCGLADGRIRCWLLS